MSAVITHRSTLLPDPWREERRGRGEGGREEGKVEEGGEKGRGGRKRGRRRRGRKEEGERKRKQIDSETYTCNHHTCIILLTYQVIKNASCNCISHQLHGIFTL